MNAVEYNKRYSEVVKANPVSSNSDAYYNNAVSETAKRNADYNAAYKASYSNNTKTVH